MPTASFAGPLASWRRAIGTVAVLAALVAGLALIPNQATARSSRVAASFLGMTPNDVSGTYDANQLRFEKAAGVGLFRQLFDWAAIEKTRGNYDFQSVTDSYVLGAAHKGITILPILFDAPAFRARQDPNHRITYPPRNAADIGAFGAQVVKRYGPNGTIWRGANSRFRKYAIRSYQIWNEPNLAQYWGGRPNAGQYTRLLAGGARGIKHADRHAEIVTAGIPQSTQRGAIPLSRYLPQLLRAKAARYFTILAANAYSHDARGILRILAGVRTTLDRGRARGANIWLTEFGWADVGPRSQFRLGAAGQARQLNALIVGAAKARAKLRLRGFIYYNWQDLDPSGRGDFVGNHMGLLTRKGTPKRAYDAYSSAARRVR